MRAYRWAKTYRGELSAPQFAVLLTIADRFNDEEGRAWPAYSTIADDTRLCRRTVIRAMDVLAAKGLVEVEQRYDNKGNTTSNNYRLPLHQDLETPVDNSSDGRVGQ
jgi:DNA-binding MarR family transcriptional regulator